MIKNFKFKIKNYSSFLNRVRSLLFFLIVFFISSQVGLHFWPQSAFISGIRIDYLSPTLYLLDILVLFFILFSIPRFRTIKIPNNTLLKVFLVLFFLNLIINIFLSKSPVSHIYGIIKFIEFSFFGFLVADLFEKKMIKFFVDTICLSAIFSSFLAILQFSKQGSVGGFFYFLGERSFNISTIGISTVNAGEQLLRSYGAFPHPNVLSFFLLIAIVFAAKRIAVEKQNYEKLFLIFTVLISFLALIFTFSRITILLALLFLFYEIYFKRKRNSLVILMFIFFTSVSLFLFREFLTREFLLRGINFRSELFSHSLSIFLGSPYLGIGINNFYTNQAPLIKTISPIMFQPVHNIFILWLLQFGIFAFWILPYLFYLAIRSLFKKLTTTNYELRTFYRGVFFILFSIIIAAMFDHFFLTLEQGQIMLALILGLSFAGWDKRIV